MAKQIILVFLICLIKTGTAVRLTDFKPIGTPPFESSLKSFTQNDAAAPPQVVYVNQSLFYFTTFYPNFTVFSCYVSVENLTDLTTTHRLVNSEHISCPLNGNMFALNGRVFMALVELGDGDGVISGLLVWDDDQWRPLNGNFPYSLGTPDMLTVRLKFRPHIGKPDVVYIMNECQPLASLHCHIHRLELIDDRVVIEHVAGFTLKDFQEVSFFTVWNGMVSAFVAESDEHVKKYTVPIPDEPLAIGQNSSFVAIEPVPQLVDGRGYQIDNFVVFTKGRRRRVDSTNTETLEHASILDLNTMQITETDVQCLKFSYYVVDTTDKRLIDVEIYEVNKMARLLT